MKVSVLIVAMTATCLSGCAVVSDEPLFSAGQAAPHPLAEGLWALSGPGCDVRPDPVAPLPDCAMPVSIRGGRMNWDTVAYIGRTFGPAGQALSAMPLPKTSAFLLVEGDPDIVELLNGPTNDAPPAPAGLPPRPPLKPSYLALREVHVSPTGRVDAAIVWPVLCPMTPGQPGFEATPVGCRVTSIPALRERAAKPPPPAMSLFMTWIRGETGASG